MPLLQLPSSSLQNQCKTAVLPVLPPTAPLEPEGLLAQRKVTGETNCIPDHLMTDLCLIFLKLSGFILFVYISTSSLRYLLYLMFLKILGGLGLARKPVSFFSLKCWLHWIYRLEMMVSFVISAALSMHFSTLPPPPSSRLMHLCESACLILKTTYKTRQVNSLTERSHSYCSDRLG